MKLKNIKIKNFKSFGNNENFLEFSEKGGLNLIVGKNGNGKSTIIDSIDYALYGKVKGKKTKTVPVSNLPNRFNKNLRVELNFTSYKEDINIIRSINPNKLYLSVNGEPNDKAGKSHKQKIIENKVGLDFETFKSFISMSINDFKNFMTLTPEEKRVLLDRLFNLEMINNISKILKEKKKNHKHEIELFETEIQSYESSLMEFNQSVEKIKESEKKNLDSEKEEIKKLINSEKDNFKNLKEKINKCDIKEKEIKNKISENQKSIAEISYKIKDYQSKIKVYDSGKCPTCGNTLSDETHNAYRNEMVETVNKLKETYNELNKQKEDFNGKNIKLNKIRRDTENSFSDLKAYLTGLKSKIKELNDKETDSNVNHLLESIENIKTKKKESNNNLKKIKDKEAVVSELTKLFSSDGIKKAIIAKIVKPINHFIKESLDKLDMGFQVELDNDFTAKLTSLGEEIHVETLSTGETKKVNLAIMISYLKLIRMKRNINVLFLDEVFASIDVEGIYDILNLLKDFALDYKIDIFLIHHALLEESLFDRILKIEKNVTSNIIEEKKYE